MGAVATLAWGSYGDAIREMIANSYRLLSSLSPQEPVAQSFPEAIALSSRGYIDKIATDIATISRASVAQRRPDRH
jgi:hypothetical protein